MEGTRVHLTRVYNMLPAENAPRHVQSNQCAILVPFLNNGRAAIIENLLREDFAAMSLDELTHNIVEWKNVFRRIRVLVELCEERLGAITNKRFRVHFGLLAIHLEVGQVISRAIARLFVLQNLSMAPELELDQLFQ